ncbi:MAG: hypothetical protein J3K34DRAFT_42862 [Monoraphidium minutum]|nr:MAG: hypothetical protein J3K34DRAFT_42862 [Monoraphidium minutum]
MRPPGAVAAARDDVAPGRAAFFLVPGATDGGTVPVLLGSPASSRGLELDKNVKAVWLSPNYAARCVQQIHCRVLMARVDKRLTGEWRARSATHGASCGLPLESALLTALAREPRGAAPCSQLYTLLFPHLAEFAQHALPGWEAVPDHPDGDAGGWALQLRSAVEAPLGGCSGAAG